MESWWRLLSWPGILFSSPASFIPSSKVSRINHILCSRGLLRRRIGGFIAGNYEPAQWEQAFRTDIEKGAALMTYLEAIQFLYDLRWFGTKLGLANVFRLAALAGNPQRRLRFIHVAGTNGKGSTCAMLESIYRMAGWRVGLFTSPHLIAFGERIQVNRRLIGPTEVVRLVEELQPLLKKFPAAEHPTFFEVVTI